MGGLRLDVLQRLGDRYCEATVLTYLGGAHHAAGALDTAHRAWQRPLQIFDELDHPDVAQTRIKLRALGPSVADAR